jgi:hypothetical protein
VRELLLRDLGGFYLEAHRSEQGPEAHHRLLDVKARRLATLDGEVRELESGLSEDHPRTVLRAPGIGGTCPRCGELHASDARFCSRCGSPLTSRAARAAPATGAGSTPPGTGTLPPATGAAAEEERIATASLWGRPRTPEAAAPAPTQAGSATQASPEPDGPEQRP